MKYQVEISKIIEGGIKLDKEKVINYANLLSQKLIADGDKTGAQRINRIIEANSNTLETKSSIFKNLANAPVDIDSRYSMVDIIYPESFKKTLVLGEKVDEDINYFIANYQKSDELAKAGLDIANKLLLYGPPGNGKTQIAHYIANKLNLPLLITRLDSIVSSYLGTTAKNIRALFEYADKIPCVLFLDEFDAIAKKRDDSNELGELKRVVNSLLQNIDTINSNSLLIAATNHEKLLDSAVWRRFDYKIHIGKPETKDIIKFLTILLPEFSVQNEKIEILSNMLYGKSGAEIENFVKQERRESIIMSREFTMDNILKKATEEKIEQTFGSIEVSNSRKILFLRNINPKVFTYDIISEIIGVSKSTISKVIRGEENNG